MPELTQQLLDEVVADYAGGRITRREARQRLAAFGIVPALAIPLLAAQDARRDAAGSDETGPAQA
ncbi:hypothetical protein QEZ54_06750 [Catellatospora sp. KI3]|uniref:hypothetical protein n=1 Tax=Catellatospora sp. KI3 TaxID=3041620 RepID=UPI0024830E85|nr:hypothetical protein [Catellatospora sp. KI3]MDI1460657.1 hypothetical protein [Catellatospora sp. KI3]